MWSPRAKLLWKTVCEAFSRAWRSKAKSSRQLVYEALNRMTQGDIMQLIADHFPHHHAYACRGVELNMKPQMIDCLMGISDHLSEGLTLRRALKVDTDEELALKAGIDSARGARRSASFAGITVIVSLIAVLLAYCRPAQQNPMPPQAHTPAAVINAAPAISPTTTQAAQPSAARPDS